MNVFRFCFVRGNEQFVRIMLSKRLVNQTVTSFSLVTITPTTKLKPSMFYPAVNSLFLLMELMFPPLMILSKNLITTMSKMMLQLLLQQNLLSISQQIFGYNKLCYGVLTTYDKTNNSDDSDYDSKRDSSQNKWKRGGKSDKNSFLSKRKKSDWSSRSNN